MATDDGNQGPTHPEITAPDELYRPCNLDKLDFQTTDDLEDGVTTVGQARAEESVRFGMGMNGDGFNVYALGPEDTRKREIVRHFLEERAREEPTPDDLCYVNNFEDSNEPNALCLPPGTGRELAREMDRFAEDLAPALRAAFESEEYQNRRQAEEESSAQGQQEAVEDLQKRAEEKDLTLLRTPTGFVFTPVRDDEPVPAEELEELSQEEREELEEEIQNLHQELQGILRQVPKARREFQEKLRSLDQEMARATVRDLLEKVREHFQDNDEIQEHLDAIEKDVAENIQLFKELASAQQQAEGGGGGPMGGGGGPSPGGGGPGGPGGPGGGGGQPPGESMSQHPLLRRYKVNVAVDHQESEHAPVVYLDHPTYQKLAGWVEYQPFQGALVTDFNMIRSGALHRANGGYLVVDVQRILLQPFAWEGLKRALQSRELNIESPRQMMGLVSTVTLDPEAVPLNVKVVLLGSRLLYYLLSAYDPDFPELFKVEADFDDRMDRSHENEELYAKLIAGAVQREELRPFGRDAVARVIERSARMAGDGEKLSVRTRGILDLLKEADHWAEEAGSDSVEAEHVQTAVDHRIYRASRLRDRIQEEIERNTIFIDTEGVETGQANGLSVLQLGGFAFGRPSRITARYRLGKGEVVNIEREVELSGPIHSKGVLILAGFLGGRYAQEYPLSLSASLVFEQSYGGVDGDSASSAELYALLSALSEVPLKQSVSVTGSVNQRGQIQPVGGVNEKIEGFFDVCRTRGLTGEQGVLIPAANTKHLMLRKDVVEAIRDGDFHVWPVETVDQGMEILTGQTMGEREDGRYPEGTVNAAVENRLEELAERWKGFAGSREGGE